MLGVGIGIHTGQASIGEIGKAYKDFTITGPVVKPRLAPGVASRLFRTFAHATTAP